ncbi:MAG: alpha amylase C-terminal domain-containing protein, partial [Gammaproteobacteria bacterium]|nr:alpha amylase C-terminal domain-containing protein [Gammaproteobacteria bacterium]
TAQNALWEHDYEPCGFQWIDAHNSQQSILSFMRNGKTSSLLFVCNFTPVVYYDYSLGVPKAGAYVEVFNSDRLEFGGSGQIITEKLLTIPEGLHNFSQYLTLKIPPMSVIVLKHTT